MAPSASVDLARGRCDSTRPSRTMSLDAPQLRAARPAETVAQRYMRGAHRRVEPQQVAAGLQAREQVLDAGGGVDGGQPGERSRPGTARGTRGPGWTLARSSIQASRGMIAGMCSGEYPRHARAATDTRRCRSCPTPPPRNRRVGARPSAGPSSGMHFTQAPPETAAGAWRAPRSGRASRRRPCASPRRDGSRR